MCGIGAIMKVLVTGGTGNVGRAAVRRLVKNGHHVRVIGRRADIEIKGAEYHPCDITDYERLREHVRGQDGIIHLAAVPYPGGGPGQQVFHVNCTGTYNVYRAAADEGVARISNASSINALGFNFGIKSFRIQYFPVDEAHSTCTTDSYSFSKQVTEEIGAYFWRREGISSIHLRFPGVYEVHPDQLERMSEYIVRFQEAFAELMSVPEAERQERVQRAVARFDTTRLERSLPMSRDQMRKRWRATREYPDMALLLGAFGRSNFWASIDARDSAQALEKGLLADYQGSHTLFINDSHNAAGIDSELLASTFFPDVTDRKHVLSGTETLVSIDRARALIGFELEHSISERYPDKAG
jgi:UDP-glucose 4-epimerase